MEYDRRQALPQGYALIIREEKTGNTWAGTVTEEIGRGGSCLVYRGTQQAFVGLEPVNRPVIIKEFFPKALDDSIQRNADGALLIPEEKLPVFEKRLSSFCVGQANHILFSSEHASQTLPPLFASGRGNGTFYAISSPGEGISLDKLDRSGLTLPDALRLTASIAEAIHSVHQNGLRLYLDLKPANIYVHKGQAFLFDFDTVQPKERLRYCSCSYGWSAPEQEIRSDGTGYLDTRKIGFHTDVYGIAAVLFYLLTGKKPSLEDLDKACWKELVTLSDPTSALQSEQFLAELSRIMRSALEQDAERRAIDYGGSQAAFKIRNELKALSAIACNVPNQKIFEKTQMSVDKVSENVLQAQTAIEETVKNHSLKLFLFGSGKRIFLTVMVLTLMIVVTGVIMELSGRITGRVLPTVNYQEEITDQHLLLTLKNGNHSYEMGLENWRRLDYARAERDLIAAGEELEKELSQDSLDMARLNNSLGCLYLDKGKYEHAYDCLNSAYVAFRDTKGENAAETMAVLFSVAQYDYMTGEVETAQKTLKRILDHTDTSSHPGAAACVLLYQAQIYADLGDHASAEAGYERTLNLYQDILKNGRLVSDLSKYANDAQLTESEKDHRTAAMLWIIRTWTAMSLNLLETNNAETAEKTLQQALEICLNDVYIGRKNLVTSRVYLALARANQALGKTNEALDAVDLAMRIQLNLFNFSEEYPGLTEVYDTYGQIHLENEDTEKAGEYFQKALDLAQTAYGKNHATTAKAFEKVGLYKLTSGDDSDAVQFFLNAVEIRRNILGYQHPETVRYLYHLSIAAGVAGDTELQNKAAGEAARLCKLLNLQGQLAELVGVL